MPSRDDWRAALAICAAIIGAGFASGREIVSFFSQFGAASWLGIAAAATGIGAITYVLILLSAHTGAGNFPELYGALMGQPCQDAMHALFGLLCLITASAMLSAGGELGALAFSWPNAYALGLALTLVIGLAATLTGFRALAALGALLAPLIALYYLLMAQGAAAPSASFSGLSALRALPMGLMYASFNTAMAGGAICLSSRRASPFRTALLTGGILFILLALANLAMLRAEPFIRELALPSVALSAKWGIQGYYASIFLMWLAVVTTLCAMLFSLRAQIMAAGLKRLPALMTGALGACMLSVCGFPLLVNAIYPLLGWICGFALLALICFLPEHEHQEDDIPAP